jgi:hypothetical protein
MPIFVSKYSLIINKGEYRNKANFHYLEYDQAYDPEGDSSRSSLDESSERLQFIALLDGHACKAGYYPEITVVGVADDHRAGSDSDDHKCFCSRSFETERSEKRRHYPGGSYDRYG